MRRVRAFALLVALGATAGSVAGEEPGAHDPAPSVLDATSFAGLAGSFENLASDLGTVESGGLEIALTSPRNRVTVYGNRLVLRPALGGDWAALLEVELEGDGDVEADLAGSGRLSDRLVAPRQTLRVASTVRLTRGDGGYRVALVDPPATLPIEIESGFAQRLVSICDGLAIFLAVDCEELSRSLRFVDVPMPGPSEVLAIPEARLSADERAFLDAHLAPL